MLVGKYRLVSMHNGRFIASWNDKENKNKRKMIPNLEDSLDRLLLDKFLNSGENDDNGDNNTT